MSGRDNIGDGWVPIARPLANGVGADVGGSAGAALPAFVREGRWADSMREERVDARPLTSLELLDAAVWREIGSEEAQLAAAFLDALSRLVGDGSWCAPTPRKWMP